MIVAMPCDRPIDVGGRTISPEGVDAAVELVTKMLNLCDDSTVSGASKAIAAKLVKDCLGHSSRANAQKIEPVIFNLLEKV